MIYGDVEGFKEYFTDRGKGEVLYEWDDDKIKSALLVASEWLDGQFETLWIGYKTEGFKQERSWPRTAASTVYFPYYNYEKNEIPEQVVKATYEAAYRECNEQGCLQTDFKPSRYKNVSVSGAVAVEYNDLVFSSADSQLEIPIIQKLMEHLVDPEKVGSISALSGQAVRV